jgi:hypothetical protein
MKDLYKELTKVLSSLPGIELSGNNLSNSFDKIKSSWGGPRIFFISDEKETEGLFFLTRCLDTRYWKYGHLWRIELTVSDQIKPNGDRPLTYDIYRQFIKSESSPTGEETEEEIDKEISSLIDNMHYHFHHDNFMLGYNMDRRKYDLKEWRREIKLNELGII